MSNNVTNAILVVIACLLAALVIGTAKRQVPATPHSQTPGPSIQMTTSGAFLYVLQDGELSVYTVQVPSVSVLDLKGAKLQLVTRGQVK